MSVGGLSKVRLDRLHDVMVGYVERGDVPGLVTLLSRRGEVHVDAIGMKAFGGSDPMRRRASGSAASRRCRSCTSRASGGCTTWAWTCWAC